MGVNANKTVDHRAGTRVQFFVGVCVYVMFDGRCQIGRAQEAAGGEESSFTDFSPGPRARQNQYIFKVDTPT